MCLSCSVKIMSLGLMWLIYKLLVIVTFIAVREFYEVLKSVLEMRERLKKPWLREGLSDSESIRQIHATF